ncbi:MAG: adenosine kinase [Halobacteriovoraceae bacterium]|nr:adenosine kinase [Halobacteriovoraceae bacterium]
MGKKYHVYGIGNALLDMEFEVDESFLKKSNIEKGLMTLVDEKRQNELLDEIEGIKHKRSCGGSAANTMIAIAQLGGKAFYSCRVANDEQGEYYMKDLLSNGLKSNLVSTVRPEGHTGKCLVFITPDADRTMNSHLGVSEGLSTMELIDDELISSEYVYIEGYLVTSNTGREAAIKARELAEAHGVKTALTFSDPGMVEYFRDGLNQMLGEGVDLLFCNEYEALSYTGAKDVQSAAESLKSIAKKFAITTGPKGALVYDGQSFHQIKGINVKAVDTNGAGDLFAGCFLYAITHGYDFSQAGKLACEASSKLVTQFGARLVADQLKTILKNAL